jgi:hypothetical protein
MSAFDPFAFARLEGDDAILALFREWRDGIDRLSNRHLDDYDFDPLFEALTTPCAQRRRALRLSAERDLNERGHLRHGHRRVDRRIDDALIFSAEIKKRFTQLARSGNRAGLLSYRDGPQKRARSKADPSLRAKRAQRKARRLSNTQVQGPVPSGSRS